MENKFLLDVRNPDEYSLGSLPGAVNIPLDELRDRLAELPKDKMILYLLRCRTTGYLAYRILTQHEFDKVRNLSGGLKTYRAATAPIIIREENGNEIDESPEQQGGSPQVGQPAVAKVSDTTVTATAAVTADALATPLKQFG
jgi:rhodanese-related sulfurtransferase